MPSSAGAITGPAATAVERHKPAEFAIERIGIVGQGHLGHAFATNLAEDGYNVLVHDRDPKRIADLLPTGVCGAAQPGDLANCDAVLTSLPDDDALAAVTPSPDGLASILAGNRSTLPRALSARVCSGGSPRSTLERR